MVWLFGSGAAVCKCVAGGGIGISGCVVGVRAVKCCSEARPTRVPRSPICVCDFCILAMFVVVSGAAVCKCGAGGSVFRVVLVCAP